MKHSFFYIAILFFIGTLQAQELPKPIVPAPENAFYKYLDNEQISDPSKYQGNVKKVIKTFREYDPQGKRLSTQKVMQFVNRKNQLERTETREYEFGLEINKTVENHLEQPEFTLKKEKNRVIKIIENTQEDVYDFEEKGVDQYVYENELLMTFFNKNDSITYTYNNKQKLTEIRSYESLILESFDEDETSSTLWRSSFEENGLTVISYENELPIAREMYHKFGEVIDHYKTTYTYSKIKQLEKFQTVYTRYLYDYYDSTKAIDNQEYEKFPVVEMDNTIKEGVYQYTDTKNIKKYHLTDGKDVEDYTITYDENNRLHLVEGKLQFEKNGESHHLNLIYEYLYDANGNPASIKSYYFHGDKKILHKETVFDIIFY